MIRNFKPSLFENYLSKNPHHTETSQRTCPANQKPNEIIQNLVEKQHPNEFI